MAEIRSSATVTGSVTLILTEVEARALDALTGYGEDAFLRVFYERMGQHYMKPHEAGLRSLFKRVRSEVPSHLDRFTAARAAFNCTVPHHVGDAVARIDKTEMQRRRDAVEARRQSG